MPAVTEVDPQQLVLAKLYPDHAIEKKVAESRRRGDTRSLAVWAQALHDRLSGTASAKVLDPHEKF